MVTRAPYQRVGGRMFSSWLGGNMAVYPEGMGPATCYFVDTNSGLSVSGDGLSWERAFLTISEAMTAVGNLAARGRGIIFAAPGGYTEDIKTPLNAAGPFGALIAVNPTPGQSYGAAWLTASTAGVECLEVRARGWYISGFEIDALADAECIVLGGATAGNNASGVMLEDCLIVGQNQGLYGIDMQNGVSSNALQTIRRCGFFGFTSGSTAGKCIACTVSGIDQPRFIVIEDCWFGDSDNLIDMNPRGFKESLIRYSTFFANGANQNPDEKIDNTGGNDTYVYDNILGGTYSNAGGYVAGTNDIWSNLATGGRTSALPS